MGKIALSEIPTIETSSSGINQLPSLLPMMAGQAITHRKLYLLPNKKLKGNIKRTYLWGQQWPFSFISTACKYLQFICNLEASSKVVISFSVRANHFSRVCLFCISVRNRIYVIEIEVPEPVVLARYLESSTFYFVVEISHQSPPQCSTTN
jgi:hypothetical protein